jgi:hypothetical protein
MWWQLTSMLRQQWVRQATLLLLRPQWLPRTPQLRRRMLQLLALLLVRVAARQIADQTRKIPPR